MKSFKTPLVSIAIHPNPASTVILQNIEKDKQCINFVQFEESTHDIPPTVKSVTDKFLVSSPLLSNIQYQGVPGMVPFRVLTVVGAKHCWS